MGRKYFVKKQKQKKREKSTYLRVTAHIAWDTFPESTVFEDAVFLAGHLSHDPDQIQTSVIRKPAEVFRVHAHAEGTNETLPIQ